MKSSSGTLAPLEVKPLAVKELIPGPVQNEDLHLIEQPLVLARAKEDSVTILATPKNMNSLQESIHAKFDLAMRARREMPLVTRAHDDFEDIQKEAERAGLSVEAFLETHQLSLDDRAQSRFRDETATSNRAILTSNVNEVSSIVRECMQPVSQTHAEMALEQMKELLRARMEARDLQIEVPEMSPEQSEALNFWMRSSDSVMNNLAKQILYRFH